MLIRVLDVETCGLAPPAAVVELAHCDLRATEPSAWQVVGGKAWFCDPGHPIPPEMSAIHHITDEDVAGAEPFDAVGRRMFATEFGDDELVAVAAHNDRFDRQWITEDVIGHQRWIDIYRCALWLWPDAPAHNLQTLRYWLKPEGLGRETPHRAYGDAYVAAHILRDMLKETSGKQLVAWSSGPALLPRLTFGKHAMKPMEEVPTDYLDWMVKQDMEEDVLFTARHHLKERAKQGAV